MSRSRPMGSMTAPERICAPTSDPFSTTTTLVSGESCLSRIAAASPAGPAPTITTSNSIASRAGNSSALISPPVGDRVPARCQAWHRGPGYYPRPMAAQSPADRAIGRHPRGLIGPCYSNSKDTAILSKRYANRWWRPPVGRRGRTVPACRRDRPRLRTFHPRAPQAWLPALPHGLTAPGMNRNRDQAARELLAFYQEAGVDALVDEAPVDRFADHPPPRTMPTPPAEAARSGGDPAMGAPSVRVPPPEPPVRAGAAPPPSPDAADMAAREAARNAASLEELREILGRFEGCALRTTATQLVFADGNPKARVMFVGEAPGRDEDIEGLPFIGRSGKLLDRMLAAIGLDRTSVYIANIVPWRPPGNRTPTPQESAICLPFTLRQIELAGPDVLVCMGGPSAQTLLNVRDGILKTRGRWFAYQTGTREIRAIATLHPAYLLRQPLQKRLAWRDFLAIKKALAAA